MPAPGSSTCLHVEKPVSAAQWLRQTPMPHPAPATTEHPFARCEAPKTRQLHQGLCTTESSSSPLSRRKSRARTPSKNTPYPTTLDKLEGTNHPQMKENQEKVPAGTLHSGVCTESPTPLSDLTCTTGYKQHSAMTWYRHHSATRWPMWKSSGLRTLALIVTCTCFSGGRIRLTQICSSLDSMQSRNTTRKRDTLCRDSTAITRLVVPPTIHGGQTHPG